MAMGDQWSRHSRGSSPPPGLWMHLAELGWLVGGEGQGLVWDLRRLAAGGRARGPALLSDRPLAVPLDRAGLAARASLGFYGPSLQRVWPERHRRELTSPYIRNPDRARRILLRSPWADLSTEDTAAAGRYQSATGLSRRPETIMAEVLALPARTRRALLDRGGYGASVITELPFAALRAAYADLGVDQVTARAWYRAGIGPREAADWTSTRSAAPTHRSGARSCRTRGPRRGGATMTTTWPLLDTGPRVIGS